MVRLLPGDLQAAELLDSDSYFPRSPGQHCPTRCSYTRLDVTAIWLSIPIG